MTTIWHAAAFKNSRKEGRFSVVPEPTPAAKSSSRNIFNYQSDFEKTTTTIAAVEVPAQQSKPDGGDCLPL